MGNKTKANQEGGGSASRRQGGNFYNNTITVNISNHKINIAEAEDTIFTKSCLSVAAK